MTSTQILASIDTLQQAVEANLAECQKNRENPAWLQQVRGAFLTAKEKLNLHIKNNEAPKAPAPSVPAAATPLPAPNTPALITAQEEAALRAAQK